MSDTAFRNAWGKRGVSFVLGESGAAQPKPVTAQPTFKDCARNGIVATANPKPEADPIPAPNPSHQPTPNTHADCASRCRTVPSVSTSPSEQLHCTRPPSNCSWYSVAYSPPFCSSS